LVGTPNLEKGGAIRLQSVFRYSNSARFSVGFSVVPTSWPQQLLAELRLLQSVVRSHFRLKAFDLIDSATFKHGVRSRDTDPGL
jgi:hypothetical protein